MVSAASRAVHKERAKAGIASLAVVSTKRQIS
jgi:hypothetical protein